MERTAAIPRRLPLEHVARRIELWAVGAWLLGFVVVFYLAAAGGGYDPVVHGEVGLAVWWIVLSGVLGGVLAARIGTAGWIAFGLLAAFVALTAIATTWSESVERTVAELARVATYLGVLGLGLLVVAGRPARPLVNGLASGFAAVAVVAVLSRLHPVWFPANDHAEFLPEALNRLSYPLNSWNGLASFIAMGIPLVLGCAMAARSRLAQGLAAAAVPLMALCVFLTASRGGAISLVVGVIALLALTGDRPAALASMLVTGAGAAVVISAAAARDALESGLVTSAARSQGDELLVLCVLACSGVALLQVAVGLGARHARRPRWMTPAPRRTAIIALAGAVIVAGIGLSANADGWISQTVDEFKNPGGPGTTIANPTDVTDRLTTVSGNGRWQYWQSSVDAMQTSPLRGTGPGTFEFWWARNATIPSFVRDAHSLYFETLGELGIPGLALLLGLLLVALVGGTIRAVRAVPEARAYLAPATASIAVFMAAASVDWVWELAVIPCALALLVAVTLTARSAGPPRVSTGPQPPVRLALPARGVLAATAATCIVAVALPLAGTTALRRSQADANAGRLDAALAEARTAAATQPYAATPPLQQALVFELAGNLATARAAAVRATSEEPTNWRTWVVRSRLEAQAGDAKASVVSFRRARALNPRSQLIPR